MPNELYTSVIKASFNKGDLRLSSDEELNTKMFTDKNWQSVHLPGNQHQMLYISMGGEPTPAVHLELVDLCLGADWSSL